MTIRITQGMTAASVLADIETNYAKLSKTQTILSTGLRINQPSDDPYGTAQALDYQAALAQTKQYESNVQSAQSWLNVTDTALSNISSLVQRARDLVVQAGDGALGSSGLQSIATEISQIIDAIKSEANTQYNGEYVFAGTQTTTQPYQLGANDTYSGDSGQVIRQIGPNTPLQVNTIGLDAIGGVDPSTGQATGLLATLRTVLADLNSGNTAGLQGADLKAIDADSATLEQQQALVGARSDRATTASSRLAQIEQIDTTALANAQDADMAKTEIDFSQEQAVFQAALQAGAQLLQPTLMNFLPTG